MNLYAVTFVYLKGADTPCVTVKLTEARDKDHALHLIDRRYQVLRWLDVDRQFVESAY